MCIRDRPKGAVAKDKDGKPITNAYGVKQKWQFKEWQVEGKDKIWSKGSKIEDKFTEKVTTIVAKYNLDVYKRQQRGLANTS